MNPLLIGGIVLGALLLYVWSVYNGFVTLKGRIKASLQEIGNQLKRQADMIPQLVNSVKGYMKHETKALEMITDARKSAMSALDKGTPKDLLEASTKMTQALGAIRVIVESTPQLQAAGPVQQLMGEERDTADKIMYARRTLIDLSADYNIKLMTFPSNLVASIFGFKSEEGLTMPGDREYATVKPEDIKTPKVDL